MQKIVDAEGFFLLGIIVIIRRKFEKKNTIWTVVKEYLQLENLREGMLGCWCLICNSSRLLMFLYHADVRVWEVSNKTTGN
jgi:peptidyl-dipeptidase Dcp